MRPHVTTILKAVIVLHWPPRPSRRRSRRRSDSLRNAYNASTRRSSITLMGITSREPLRWWPLQRPINMNCPSSKRTAAHCCIVRHR
jgi:hypothetical protein